MCYWVREGELDECWVRCAHIETTLANMCSAVSSRLPIFPPPFGNPDISPLPPTSGATPIPSPISVPPCDPIPAPPRSMPSPAALISTPAPARSGGGAASMTMELPATSVISSSSATAPIVLATPVSPSSSSSPGITPILLSTSASLPNSNSSAAPSARQSPGAAEATLVNLMSVFGAVIGVTVGISMGL
ncbi:hypothetical protein GGX14DRAFT_397635 [Mycena pura]|uniref:Uncharacterized protein n=1 Tax=Mycena pura TaxID=153505 RepID=A0AAD6VBZ4_9AGAR|nr:hypothetical protein GGX14DRAFT_397635 [Mycena pura]